MFFFCFFFCHFDDKTGLQLNVTPVFVSNVVHVRFILACRSVADQFVLWGTCFQFFFFLSEFDYE